MLPNNQPGENPQVTKTKMRTLRETLDAFTTESQNLSRGLSREINKLDLDGVKLRQDAISEIFQTQSETSSKLALVRKSLNKRSVELRIAKSKQDKATGRPIDHPINEPVPLQILADPNGNEFVIIGGMARFIAPNPSTNVPVVAEEGEEPQRGPDTQTATYS